MALVVVSVPFLQINKEYKKILSRSRRIGTGMLSL